VTDETAATIAKALAHPARMHIVRLLASQQECMGSDLFRDLPLAQSTISQHLAVLRDAGIVRSHALGPSSVYCLSPEAVRAFAEDLLGIVAAAPSCPPPAEECR
jgi:DNA-binding transcriptional ArsR family regulator